MYQVIIYFWGKDYNPGFAFFNHSITMYELSITIMKGPEVANL